MEHVLDYSVLIVFVLVLFSVYRLWKVKRHADRLIDKHVDEMRLKYADDATNDGDDKFKGDPYEKMRMDAAMLAFTTGGPVMGTIDANGVATLRSVSLQPATDLLKQPSASAEDAPEPIEALKIPASLIEAGQEFFDGSGIRRTSSTVHVTIDRVTVLDTNANVHVFVPNMSVEVVPLLQNV